VILVAVAAMTTIINSEASADSYYKKSPKTRISLEKDFESIIGLI
jgi:hypothetical protein